MPTNYDFSYLKDQEVVDLSVPGWEDIKIEFATTVNATQEQQIFWRVKGTDHTFRVYLSFLLEYYQEDYEKYFASLLIDFRKNYKEWDTLDVKEPWMDEYKNQFKKFIK